MGPVARHYTPSERKGRIRNVSSSFPSDYPRPHSGGHGDEFLVESINGIANGTEGRFWFYYVNEQPGQIAASEHETSPGDRVEWLFVE